MSNVLKSVYFNVDAKQKHIIDSEQRMEELIPQMYTAEESKQDSYTFQPLTAEELASGQAQSFQDGIPVIHMDDVREEERQKLSDDAPHGEKERCQQGQVDRRRRPCGTWRKPGGMPAA